MMSDISNGEAMWGRMSVLRRGLNRPQVSALRTRRWR